MLKAESENRYTASKESFLMVLDILEKLNIRYWVEGGWGIDVLIGKQTREHRDIDIDFDADFEALLMDRLLQIGYRITSDCRPSRVELLHPEHGYIDIHPFVIEESGNMKQANPQGGWFDLEAGWFSQSVFEGRLIPCVSFEGQPIFHSGYDLREVDKADLNELNMAFSKVTEGN